MPFLPIAERELRVAARKTATYHTRFWAVLFALVAFSWQLLTLVRQNRPSTTHGQALFITLSIVAFFYCLFIGARVTADCLSEEKREGTLGLLFLTDLKGYDIVFGKLVANSINAFYGLIAIFPMLAICLLLGGISFSQFAQVVLVLLTTLFFSLSAGIFVSTYNRTERVAMFFTIFLILACAFGPILVGIVLSSSFGLDDRTMFSVMFTPAMSLLVAFEPATAARFPVFIFSASLITTWILTIIFLRGASVKLPHSWQEKGPKPPTSKLKNFQLPQPDKVQANKFRAQALEINPFLWLTLRGREKLNHAWGFVIAVIVIWFLGFLGADNVMWDYDLLFPTLLFIHAFLKIWVTSEACTRLVEDRRNGALELLLSTPLDAKDIVRGQHFALSRQFSGPLLLLVILESLCFVFGILGRGIPLSEKAFLPSAIILLIADFFTLRWVAMWIGLNARNVNRAVLKTSMLVLALPWVIYSLLKSIAPFVWMSFVQTGDNIAYPAIWIIVALLTNFILFYWAKSKLLKQFRLLATQPVRATK